MPSPRKPAATDKVLSRRILVEIGRDITTKVSKIIWLHEYPLLEEIHGAGDVKRLDPASMDDGYRAKISAALLPFNKVQDKVQRPSDVAGLDFVFFGDAEAEYNRLVSAYGMHVKVELPVVEKMYGRFSEGRFERVLGLADFSDMPDAQLRGIAIEYGHIPALGMSPSAEERRQVSEAVAKLNNMPREELIQLVEGLVGEFA